MARESIFERKNCEIDLTKKYNDFEYIIYEELYDFTGETINKLFEENFRKWKFRKNYLFLKDFRKDLGFDWNYYSKNDTEISINSFMDYCELIANLVLLTYDKMSGSMRENVDVIMQTMRYDLEKMNFEFHEDHEGKILVVEKDRAAIATAEVLDDNLADEVIEYNHYLLRGDLSRKKHILLALADFLEPKRKLLQSVNKTLDNNIFYLFNNLNIRHNNKEQGKYYCEHIAEMNDEQLEEWYDETYQTALFAILSLEQIERNKKICELKAVMNGEDKKS